MLNRTIYLMLSAATLSASSLPTNSVVKINTAAACVNYQYPRKVSKVADYTGSGAIVFTKESLIRFGFEVHYYA